MKELDKNGIKFVIGQVNTVDIPSVLERQEELEKAIEEELKEKELALFASKFINSFAVKSSKSVPAFNISKPYSFISIPAIFSNSSNAFSSCLVVVGDLSNNVSDIIALAIKIASSLLISIPLPLKSWNKIVDVQPYGLAV